MIRSLWDHRNLVLQLTKRDILARYKGSMIGLAWSLVNPVLLLCTYTFVFSVVFKVQWENEKPDSNSQFAVLLFMGMIVHGLVSELLMRAPMLIVSNSNYVKKIIFPLEILTIVAMGASLFQAIVSLLVLTSALWILNGFVPWTVVFLPIVFLPLIMLSLGVAWVLASLGVFLRDISQPIGLAMTILLFLSPVFYPVSALPDYIQAWVMLNPLTFVIEQSRIVLIFGRLPDFAGLGIYSLISLIIVWAGYALFQKTRRGFANVL